ncbi:tetraacyldisaccharide 4'-kinase [Halorhodospira halochloris]|uniref:tetraacyldisaccharide 4'-kinase n=1 Tax=Halorhodospira halochloris TaxID=1052 RepID=UPI001EE8FEB6|nr:tetraacyldisaccharide 4'-kinase [Halorhodospira halochloris]
MPAFWYTDSFTSRALIPAAGLYGAITSLRRKAYRRGWLESLPAQVPVIVVGNITVGGTGKTPLVAWLVERLREQGWRPGIVSRGYGSSAGKGPVRVKPASSADEVGDEPLLLARRTAAPVYVGADRPAAVAAAATQAGCDIVVSDDGLQHYRMQRSMEIAVIDGERRLGNGRLLPAGPLRERAQRLDEVDLVVVNTAEPSEEEVSFSLIPGRPQPVIKGGACWPGGPAHAVAAIGNPQRFFRTLAQLGIEAEEHPFADHHKFGANDLAFADNGYSKPIIMTEKDAVKCANLPQSARCWYLPVVVEPSSELAEKVDSLLQKISTSY